MSQASFSHCVRQLKCAASEECEGCERFP